MEMPSANHTRLEFALLALAGLSALGVPFWIEGRRGMTDDVFVRVGQWMLGIGLSSLAIYVGLMLLSPGWRETWRDRLKALGRYLRQLRRNQRIHLTLVSKSDSGFIGIIDRAKGGVAWSEFNFIATVRVRNIDTHRVEVDTISAELFDGRRQLEMELIETNFTIEPSNEDATLPLAIPARSHKEILIYLRYKLKGVVVLSRSRHRVLLRLVTPFGDVTIDLPSTYISE